MRRVSAFLRRYLPMMLAVLVLLTVVVVLWIFSAPIAQWSRSAQPSDAVVFLGEHLLAVAILGGCLMVLALIWLPKWQAASVRDVKDRLTIENATRQTLAQIVGGTVLIAGLFFTWSSLEVSREGQVTERFTKAIDQLGAVNDKGEKQLEIRLGGIYALERIARDSERDHWPIMEILTAYVQAHAPWQPKDTSPPQDHPSSKGDPAAAPGQPLPKLATDVQAVLMVLGRRIRTHEKKDQRLDLSGTDLRGANLVLAHLERAVLRGAHLEGANLWGARLERTVFAEAHLEGANLGLAHLEGAVLQGAHLEGANLRGEDLEGAHSLTVEQLCSASSLYQAQLNPPITEQIRQQCPRRLEKPQK